MNFGSSRLLRADYLAHNSPAFGKKFGAPQDLTTTSSSK